MHMQSHMQLLHTELAKFTGNKFITLQLIYIFHKWKMVYRKHFHLPYSKVQSKVRILIVQDK